MVLIRAGFIRIFQSISIFVLSCGIVACSLVTYSYIAGDAADREDIQATIAKATDFFRLVPDAQAESLHAANIDDL